jgi:hypothetical protein
MVAAAHKMADRLVDGLVAARAIVTRASVMRSRDAVPPEEQSGDTLARALATLGRGT